MKSDSNFLLDPSPDEWFDLSKKELLYKEISPCLELLEDANQLSNIVKHFICRECLKEIPSSDSNSRLQWSRKMWGHRLDQMFLENKSSLDQVSYGLLRVSEQGLAFELFHRLVAGETELEKLSILYGEGPERFNGGLTPLQDIESLPNGISHFLLKLKVGEVAKPIKMKDKYGILKLTDFMPASRGPELEDRLLERQFLIWLRGMSDYLCNQLK